MKGIFSDVRILMLEKGYQRTLSSQQFHQFPIFSQDIFMQLNTFEIIALNLN
jgi:hypothetical protein